MDDVSARSVQPAVLELFWALASIETDAREAAAARLVAECSQSQVQHASSGGVTSTGERYSPLVKYTLARLIKGLSSGRQGARQGFALALTGVLGAVSDMRVEEALDALRTHTEPIVGSSKGREARDILIGNLFGCGAIARMVKLQQSSSAPNAVSLARLVQEIMCLAQKKAYLREPAVVLLLDTLAPVSAHDVASIVVASPALQQALECSMEDARPEHVLLAVGLQERLPSSVVAKCRFLPHSGRKTDFFDRAHLISLLPALMHSTSSHPRVHGVWGAIITMLQECASERAGTVTTFWDILEHSLFTSSHERKYLGFELFAKLLPGLPAAEVPALFSTNFMRCLVNNVGKDHTLLHPVASKCLSDLLRHVQSDAGAGLQSAVIAALQRFAGGQFDRLTQSHAVSALLQNLSDTSADEYAAQLFSSFATGMPVGAEAHRLASAPGSAGDDMEEEPDDDDDLPRILTGRRTWAVEQLSGLCRSNKIGQTLRARILRFLLVNGFFQFVPGADTQRAKLPELQAGPPTPPIESGLRDLCKTRLFGLVGEVLSSASTSARKQADNADESPASQAGETMADLLHFCHEAERAKAIAMPAAALNEHALSVRKDVRSTLKELERLAEGGSMSVRLDAAVNLLRVSLLYQLGSPDEFTADMEDLPLSLSAAFGTAGASEEAEGSPHHMDVLVDIMLSMMSKSHALIREVVERVVKAFGADITRKGIRRMLSQLARASDSRRSRASTADAATEGDDEEDVEASDDAADEDDEEEEEEGAGDEDNVEEAGGRGQKPGSDGDSDAESDGMDDDAMLKADAMLSAVLREAKKDRVEKKTASETVLHFKFRVLSLVEAFVKTQQSSPLLPETLLPLLRALVMSARGKEEALGTRIAYLIINVISKAPASAAAKVPVQQLSNMFTACMRRASQAATQNVMRAAQAAAVYVLRLLSANEGSSAGQVTAPLVEAALERCYANKKSRLTHGFFCTILERMPAVGGAVCQHSTLYLVATCNKHRVKSRHEHLVLESLKLMDKALRHKPGSPAGALVAATVDPVDVVRGLTAAVSLKMTKTKRQTELVKHAALSVQALLRLCAANDLMLPDVGALRNAATAAKSTHKAVPKVVGHLDRMLKELSSERKPGREKKRPREDGGEKPNKKRNN